MLIAIALLLVKHWLADFVWQTQWMVANKGNPTHPAVYAHSGVHVLCSLVSLLLCGIPLGWSMALVLAIEFAAHAAFDVIKANKSLGGRWRIDQPRFWTILGLDQLAHHMTYVFMVWSLLA